jgi:transposase InsO family protein
LFLLSFSKEQLDGDELEALLEARDGINQYINFYNTKRIHSAIEYKTPDEVYNKWLNDLTINSSKSVA